MLTFSTLGSFSLVFNFPYRLQYTIFFLILDYILSKSLIFLLLSLVIFFCSTNYRLMFMLVNFRTDVEQSLFVSSKTLFACRREEQRENALYIVESTRIIVESTEDTTTTCCSDNR